jgi:hypothetical protein
MAVNASLNPGQLSVRDLGAKCAVHFFNTGVRHLNQYTRAKPRIMSGAPPLSGKGAIQISQGYVDERTSYMQKIA